MNVIREIQRINEKEIDLMVTRGLDAGGSWHDEYKDSAYVFIGGLPFGFSEGDIITVFSQYGEIIDINLIREEKTGKSKGFAFLGYLDQRSTNLAVDNFNGITLGERTIRVDHVKDYKPPHQKNEDGEKILDLSYNAAPKPIEDILPDEEDEEREETKEEIMINNGIDPEDPMAPFLYEDLIKKLNKSKRKAEKKSKKSKKHKKDRHY